MRAIEPLVIVEDGSSVVIHGTCDGSVTVDNLTLDDVDRHRHPEVPGAVVKARGDEVAVPAYFAQALLTSIDLNFPR